MLNPFLGAVLLGCACRPASLTQSPSGPVTSPLAPPAADQQRQNHSVVSDRSNCRGAEHASCEGEARDIEFGGDRDGDGIIDSRDACPDLCESLNGNDDGDGCPDKPLFRIDADLQTILGRIPGLEFPPDDARIKPVSYADLDRIVEVLRRHPGAKIEIQGHRDQRSGESVRAVDISEKRALAVREYLVDKGVPPEMLFARGYGESVPIASNRTKDGRLQNRRIELVLIHPKRLVAKTCKEAK